ncbi:MFS transporter [Pantanalinema sp. GBBB05]|uniref:MFS transporter n=1 Tax=Pantanalinema sp. GBBB05 TaxID=2604139 RepID=UPI001D95FF1C|nr:MFS transporter [Pantanalinema sp. GBBB05]
MLQNGNMLGGLADPHLWIAQAVVQGFETPEQAALFFSGPRFFVALVAGLVLAFGFQLLLTNLSVAAGISYLGAKSDSDDSSDGSGIRKIGTAIGIWTLVTVSIALFAACLLAVKLSLINNVVLGGIVGLVIWGTYFCLLVWISSTTVGSLIGSVVNAAVSGFQSIVGTASAAFGAKVARDQIISTAEAAAVAVRRELTAGIDPETLRENVEDYLAKLRPAELDMNRIRQEFETLLNDPELMKVADPESLRKIDRAAIVDMVSSRTDLSKREVNRIADQLEDAWKQTLRKANKPDPMRELVDYLKSANPGQLFAGGMEQRLDQLLAELRQQRQQDNNPSGFTQMLNGLMGVVLGRLDLTDLDVDRILSQLKSARDQVTEKTDKVVTIATSSQPVNTPPSVIRADVENYLLNTYSWQMTPETIRRDFPQVLYDPSANATLVRQELEQLNRSEFEQLLQSRGVFTQDEMHTISRELEAVRRDVLKEVTGQEERVKVRALQVQIERFLRSTPSTTLLNSATLTQEFKPILEDSDVDATRLRERFLPYGRGTLSGLLNQRGDLTPLEVEQVATELERIFNLTLAESESLQQGVKTRVTNQWQRVEDYLRNTGKAELNPEGIKRDFKTLIADPQAGIHDVRARLSHFDRDTLVQLLSQRQDLSAAEVNSIIDQVETNWNQVIHTPQAVAATVSHQYDKLTHTITDYLRNTGRAELNPEGIQRDLKLLLEDPKTGTLALRDRLSQLDRESLVQLLSQRQDMTEAEANQIVDQVQNTIQQIIQAPRRLAVRTQTQLNDFKTTLEDYLRNTGKDELNPEGIKRDFQVLLNDPRLGMERLTDRLAHVDRSTIVALLSQRKDMTEAEANQIVDQVLSVRDQALDQVRAVQQQIQSVIDSITARIRHYLNSLERPELNYDGIKRDLRTLFDDPEAGFDALRDRLSQFDRGTLIALLSSREDISEADAEHIIYQVERVRNSVLHRAERVQQQVQRRLDDLKHQVQEQAEETRKAAATASWWLFATALTSATAAAIAGGLAVGS